MPLFVGADTATIRQSENHFGYAPGEMLRGENAEWETVPVGGQVRKSIALTSYSLQATEQNGLMLLLSNDCARLEPCFARQDVVAHSEIASLG